MSDDARSELTGTERQRVFHLQRARELRRTGMREAFRLVLLVGLVGAALLILVERCSAEERLSQLLPLYTAAALIDVGATEYALATNPRAFEANPLLRDRGARLAINAGVTVGAALLTRELSRSRPRLARGLKWTFVGVKVGLGGLALVQARRRP